MKHYRAKHEMVKQLLQSLNDDPGSTGKFRLLCLLQISVPMLHAYLAELEKNNLIRAVKVEGYAHRRYEITTFGRNVLALLKSLESYGL